MELFVYSPTCTYGVHSVTAPSLFTYGVHSVTAPSLFTLQPFLAIAGSDFRFYYKLRPNTITLSTYKIHVIALQLSSCSTFRV